VGTDPDKLLVHVFLGSRRVEFLDKARSGLKKTVQRLAGPPWRLAPHAQQKGIVPFNDNGNKLELFFGLSRYLSQYVLRAYAEDLDVFAHRLPAFRLSYLHVKILIPGDRR
jgi:hypothetical protein